MAANLITLTDPRSPAAEAYRRLRTNLEFASIDQPLRSVLVTAASADTDSSTTLANLAVSIAQAGRQVILVDSDLRDPCLQDLFGVDNHQGLTTALRAPAADIALQPTGVAGLSILPAGPEPDIPADLVSSPVMQELIGLLEERADIVLFDSPPVVSVTDAAVIASKVDGVLLVVSAGHTSREQAQRAKALLEKVNARLIGAVLVNAPHENVPRIA